MNQREIDRKNEEKWRDNYEKEKINATLSAEGSGCFLCGVCENHQCTTFTAMIKSL